MVLVCFLNSVVALAEGTRRQVEREREIEKSELEVGSKIITGEGVGWGSQAQENSRSGDGNKQSTERTHSEDTDTGGRENNSSSLKTVVTPS